MFRKNKKRIIFVLAASFFALFLAFGGVSLAQEKQEHLMNAGAQQGGGGTSTASKQVGLSDIMETFGGMLLKGINLLLYALFQLSLKLLGASMWLLQKMTDPEFYEIIFFSPVAVEAINTVWSFVRDFFNMFFILIIIFIAVSAILKINTYGDKNNIVKVIGAALLINFSKPITLAVIDASQVTMRFFAKGLNVSKMEFTSKIQDNIGLGGIIKPEFLGGPGFETSIAVFVMLLISTLFVLIMGIMLFILAISLVVRMISFWVLIILSPMAMFGYAVPGSIGSALHKKWSENLLHWSFYGPIMLFFLWVAFVLIDAIAGAVFGNIDVLKEAFDLEKMGAGNTLSNFTYNISAMIIPYIVAIYLLFYGYKVSQSVSTGTAQNILAWGDKKISSWGKKAGRTGLSAATLSRTRKDLKEAGKSRWEDYSKDKRGLRWTTQKGGGRVSEERQAKYKSMGKEDKSALNDLEVKRANEKLKKLKDNPPGMDALKDKIVNGKADLGDILYVSQNDELGIHNGANLYEKAMNVKGVKGNNGMMQKLKKETKNKNGWAVIDYEGRHNLNQQGNAIGANQALQDNYGNAAFRDIIKQKEEFFLDNNGNLKPETETLLRNKTANMNQNTRDKFAADIGNDRVRRALINNNIL